MNTVKKHKYNSRLKKSESKLHKEKITSIDNGIAVNPKNNLNIER